LNDSKELSPFISGNDNTPLLYNNIFNNESHKNASGGLKEIGAPKMTKKSETLLG